MPKESFADTKHGAIARVARMVAVTALVAHTSACLGEVGETRADTEHGPAAPGTAPSVPGLTPRTGGANDTPGTPDTFTGTTPSAGDGQTAFACDPAAKPATDQLRRLTMTQYRNTVSNIASWALGSAAAGATLMTELADSLRAIPDDHHERVPQDLHGSYRRLDQSLQQEHVDGFFSVGVAFGQALTQPTRLATTVGKCATDADANNDAACLDTFIARFGAKVLRRPLAADETTFYKSVYGADTKAAPAAYADVIGVMMNAPQAVYMVEHGESPVNGRPGVYQLSPFELASRLAYHFWQTAPDEELWSAAADGSLLQADVLRSQVERLHGDPRTRPTFGEFTADWLKVQDVPALEAHNDDPTFRTFAGTDLPDSALRTEMVDDVLGMVGYYVWTRPGSLDDLLTSKLGFHRGAKLGAIYKLQTWDGVAQPPAFADSERAGLLTRALFLASGSANTRPIQKGVFIRRTILCDEIPAPPAGANAVAPQLRPDMTTRQVVEELTEKPGSICASCHTSRINPLGFATEDFDGLGRLRREQRMFDASGNEVGSKPVDTHAAPMVKDGEIVQVSGPAELARVIADSGKAHACLARNYFRFTFARWENLELDGCTLETLRQRVANGGKIADMLREVAGAPSFRQRTFE